jgi:hypothetical protein
MSSNSVTVNIYLRDGAPGPQVRDATGGGDPLVVVEFGEFPATASIVVSSVEQVDRLIAALAVAKELLTGEGAS